VTPSIEQVREQLASVEHPTFGKSLLELDLVRDLALDGKRLSLRVTLHATSESLRQRIRERIEEAVSKLGIDTLV